MIQVKKNMLLLFLFGYLFSEPVDTALVVHPFNDIDVSIIVVAEITNKSSTDQTKTFSNGVTRRIATIVTVTLEPVSYIAGDYLDSSIAIDNLITLRFNFPVSAMYDDDGNVYGVVSYDWGRAGTAPREEVGDTCILFYEYLMNCCELDGHEYIGYESISMLDSVVGIWDDDTSANDSQ